MTSGNRNLVTTNPILTPSSMQSSAIKTERKNIISQETIAELFPSSVKKVQRKPFTIEAMPPAPASGKQRAFVPG